MTRQVPDEDAAPDLQALPDDLQPLYRRLSDDGNAWQAASAARLAGLAQSLVDDLERMASERALHANYTADSSEPARRVIEPPTVLSAHSLAHQHRRQWMFGTIAAVAVVALLGLVLQGALGRQRMPGVTNTHAGQWQILDRLIWKRTSWGQQLPSIAPSDPQVIYEATDLENGSAETSKAISYASLRRTENGGHSWQNLTLPLPSEYVSIIEIRVSPLNARMVFLSIWDRSSTACEPTNGVVGEWGCQRGYVSANGGDTWQAQKLPVLGILNSGGAIVSQGGRLYASNACSGDSCVHLLTSADGGLAWRVVDAQITAGKQHVCDLAATASGQTVYAVASSKDCSESPSASETTLWRSDDAGADWMPVGEFPPNPPSGTYAWEGGLGMGLLTSTSAGTAHPGLLYLDRRYYIGSSASGNGSPSPISGADLNKVGASFLYSEDNGVTWQHPPPLPAVRAAISLVEAYGVGTGLRNEAVLSDGSLLVLSPDPNGGRLTPYMWTPGARAWQRLPQLPAEVTGPGSITVTPGAKGRDAITLALRASGDASNPIAYYVVRYQI